MAPAYTYTAAGCSHWFTPSTPASNCCGCGTFGVGFGPCHTLCIFLRLSVPDPESQSHQKRHVPTVKISRLAIQLGGNLNAREARTFKRQPEVPLSKYISANPPFCECIGSIAEKRRKMKDCESEAPKNQKTNKKEHAKGLSKAVLQSAGVKS